MYCHGRVSSVCARTRKGADTIQAAVTRGKGESFHREDVELAEPGTGEVRVRIVDRWNRSRAAMKNADGSEIPPTGKSFDVDFYTVAKWDNGQIVEENLMYDLVTFMKQIGLSE